MLDVMDRLERFYGALPQPPDDPFVLYVWEVLGVQTTSTRRDAALAALKRIPALTPDSLARVARAKLEKAVALAGPYREERLRALAAGVDVFRRHRDLPAMLRGDVPAATEALRLFPHLSGVSGQWLLLFGGRHPMLPDDVNLLRVVERLGSNTQAAVGEIGEVLTALQRAALYLSHHGRVTCTVSDPLCRICPLRDDCPFPDEQNDEVTRTLGFK
jgi:endonuclease III